MPRAHALEVAVWHGGWFGLAPGNVRTATAARELREPTSPVLRRRSHRFWMRYAELLQQRKKDVWI